MLVLALLAVACGKYTRYPTGQQSFSLNGFNDHFVDWRGPGFAQQGRDWSGQCTTGQSQSPIDITDFPDPPSLLQVVTTSNSTFTPIAFQSQPTPLVVRFNGLYDMYYMFAGTSRQVISGVTTQRILSDVAFKTPAEHTVNGIRYPMSVILGYSGVLPNGDLSLGYQIYISVREGASNRGFSQFISESALDVSFFLPPSGVLEDYYYYTGSFNIPPCFESIPWVVSNYVIEASKGQIQHFQAMYVNDLKFSGGAGNVRAIQPLNGRTIYHFVSN